MPHFPKPFFRKSRNLWYVQLDSTQHNLGPDKEAAFAAYHELMRKPREKRRAQSDSIALLIDLFLDYTQKNAAPDTYEWYRTRLQQFLDRYPDLTVQELKPFHLQQWIDSIPKWSSGTKRNFCRSIIRCMNWADEQGYIEKSPIAKFKKPAGGKRERVLSEAEWQDILSCIPDPDFRDLLMVTWETGCRPQESLIVEARHFDPRNSRWVFPESESKTDLLRVVYLTDRALEITKRRAGRFPTGPIFRNSSGKPWTTEAVNCAFIRIQIRMGLRKGVNVTKAEVVEFASTLKQTKKVKGKNVPKTNSELMEEARKKLRYRLAVRRAEKFCLYTLQHTWINRMLTKGVDALTVAILAGHTDVTTISRTYQHLSQNPKFLLEQASKAG